MVRRWSLIGHFLILYYPVRAQVRLSIQDLITGSMWANMHGEITVHNHSTREYARVKILRGGSRETVGAVEGAVYDADDNPVRPCLHSSSRESVDRVDSHGRWKRPCLQTTRTRPVMPFQVNTIPCYAAHDRLACSIQTTHPLRIVELAGLTLSTPWFPL
jgi:hypothetical protein